MNLMELASLQSVPEAVDAATVNVGFVFVPRPPNLVEVAQDQPTHPNWRLLRNELRKEVIFTVASRRPIDRGDFEITLIAIVEDVDIHQKTKFRSDNV
jgi:hypothetical protein